MSEIQKKFSLDNLKKSLLYFFECGFVFFVFTMLFRYLFNAFKIIEIRPVSGFTLVFGMVFGLPGIFGCAVSNFVADILFGYPLKLSLIEIPAQLIYGFIPFFIWRSLNKKANKNPFRINSFIKFAGYILTVFITTAIYSLLYGIEMRICELGEILSYNTIFIFYNNLAFCVLIGLPFFMFASVINQREKNQNQLGNRIVKFSIIEKFILIFCVVSLILEIIIGPSVYLSYRSIVSDSDLLLRKVYSSSLYSLNIFLWVALVFIYFVEKKITKPLEKMAKISRHYGDKEDAIQTNLDIIKDCDEYISLNSEIGDLARSYVLLASDMTDFIKSLNTASNKNADYEKCFYFANQVQKSLLPLIFPTFAPCADIDIFASIKFSKDFSGDFYDYFLINNEHLAIIIADVTGRGVEAALFMAIVKNLVKDKALAGLLPEESLSEINQQLYKNNSAGLFVSVWIGIFNSSTGVLNYVNAGQTQPLYMKKDGKFESLETPVDLALAASDETLYNSSSIKLERGDKIVLYTRGITEAKNRHGEKYGTERLLDFFNKYKHIGVQELIEGFNRDQSIFIDSAELENDLTVLALEYKES